MLTKPMGVVSFPKCGRTWIRLFFEYYRQFSGLKPYVIFRHADEFEFTKRILMIRHPCDVMVSFYMHETQRKKGNVTISQFIRGKFKGIPKFNKMYIHWSQRTENQMVVRYEDLFVPDTWVDILNFLNIPIIQEPFDQSIEATKFDNIRANMDKIAKFPSAWRYLAAEHGNFDVVHPTNPEGHKFRRGKVCGYVDYLDKDDINFILDNFTFGENLEEYKQEYILMSQNLAKG